MKHDMETINLNQPSENMTSGTNKTTFDWSSVMLSLLQLPLYKHYQNIEYSHSKQNQHLTYWIYDPLSAPINLFALYDHWIVKSFSNGPEEIQHTNNWQWKTLKKIHEFVEKKNLMPRAKMFVFQLTSDFLCSSVREVYPLTLRCVELKLNLNGRGILCW